MSAAGPPALAPLLGRIVPVRADEVRALLWSFGYFFCLLAAYYVVRPVRDEMGVQFGADRLQWLFSAVFATMIALVPVFGWLAARLPVNRLLPVVYGFFALNLVGFQVALESGVSLRALAPAFFVWVSVFNLFVVSVFWSFMADVFATDAARRLFGFISAGGSLGAIAGPALTVWLAPAIGIRTSCSSRRRCSVPRSGASRCCCGSAPGSGGSCAPARRRAVHARACGKGSSASRARRT
jgi:ATP:ADP antiporter, AAA family